MRTRLPSRRVFLSAVAVSAVILAACSSAGSAPSSGSAAGVTATPAAAAKPAEAARPAAAAVAPTSVPRPSAPSAPAAPARPADADAARAATGASAADAPVAQARPAAPAPPQSANAVVPAPTPASPPNPAIPSKPADPAPVVPAQSGRMVIYVTEIGILVTNPSQLVNSLGDVVAQAGGYVAGVENKDESGVPLTTIRLKIPPDRYDSAMRQIRGLAVEVTSEKATTQDVTEEFSDVQTQLASLEATHAQLLELLKRAQTIEEILKIQEKVSQTKLQIDRLKGRETFLQRSSDLATVTVNARPAEEVLARTFGGLRTSLRRAEAQRTQTVKAIQTAKTPEEEATLRDRLGEVTLELDRLNARIADVQAKAQAASITLPSAPPDDPTTASATTDQDLLQEYLRLVGERRAAELERDRLTAAQLQQPSPETAEKLRAALVRVPTLDAQVKAVEERAKRGGVTLPTLTSDQVSALAGQPTDSFWVRLGVGWALVAALAVAVIGGLGLLLGRRFRRPVPAPAA
jgi:hypothetical protein